MITHGLQAHCWRGLRSRTALRMGLGRRYFADGSLPLRVQMGMQASEQSSGSDAAPVGVPGKLSPLQGESGDAVQQVDPSQPLAEAPAAGVGSIQYKGPILEDLDGAARHAPTLANMYGNIPNHVRSSFEAVRRVDEAPTTSAPLLVDSLTSQLKSLASIPGIGGPLRSWLGSGDELTYYGGHIPLEPYRKGQTAAYNFPRILVPREFAYRFPLDMYVDPVFQTSDPALKFKMTSHTLFSRLQGKTTLLMVFSGQPLSGLFTGVKQWVDTANTELSEYPRTQVLKMHCARGWFNRRTHALTKFQLRRQVEEDEQFTTFVYRGKWKWEYARALHLYDPQLPVVLLIDPLAYVRWHAVGLPSEDATNVFRSLLRKLAYEKKSYS